VPTALVDRGVPSDGELRSLALLTWTLSVNMSADMIVAARVHGAPIGSVSGPHR
jgi:hypothetical protein